MPVVLAPPQLARTAPRETEATAKKTRDEKRSLRMALARRLL
jgi:hypothetical protein